VELRSQLLATITMVALLFVQCEKYQQLYFAPEPNLRPEETAMEDLKVCIVQAYARSQAFLSFTLKYQKKKVERFLATLKRGDVDSYAQQLSVCGEKLLQAAEYCEKSQQLSNRSRVMELLELSKDFNQSIRDQMYVAKMPYIRNLLTLQKVN
jgi:hypothetical protein